MTEIEQAFTNMNDNRRRFLKTLLTGGAASAIIPTVRPTEVQTKIVEVTKTVIIRDEMPKNITGEEMAMWLAITAKRRRDLAAEKKNEETIVWETRS